VNLVAGLIQMDGGHPAFPQEADEATARHVDLHAIIKGAKYDLHISLGSLDEETGERTFMVPHQAEDSVLLLGVIRRGFTIEVYEITSDDVAAGERRGVAVEVFLDSSQATLRRIDSFANRL
jgi:hypothetical protein